MGILPGRRAQIKARFPQAVRGKVCNLLTMSSPASEPQASAERGSGMICSGAFAPRVSLVDPRLRYAAFSRSTCGDDE